MAHQMMQESAPWPSVMLRFGPHQCSYKTHISRANIVNAVLDADTKNIIRLGHFYLILCFSGPTDSFNS